MIKTHEKKNLKDKLMKINIKINSRAGGREEVFGQFGVKKFRLSLCFGQFKLLASPYEKCVNLGLDLIIK